MTPIEGRTLYNMPNRQQNLANRRSCLPRTTNSYSAKSACKCIGKDIGNELFSGAQFWDFFEIAKKKQSISIIVGEECVELLNDIPVLTDRIDAVVKYSSDPRTNVTISIPYKEAL